MIKQLFIYSIIIKQIFTIANPPVPLHPLPPPSYISSNYLLQEVDKPGAKIVLFTFDDAPKGESTEKILSILKKHDVPAIFFVNGIWIVKNKELLHKIKNDGHLIGNHTYSHPNLKKIPSEKVKEEIIKNNTLINDLTGIKPKYFRPPFGAHNQVVDEFVKKENMQLMTWTLGSLDWEYKSKEKIINQVMDNLHPGANILMHDTNLTAELLDELIIKIHAKGYEIRIPNN